LISCAITSKQKQLSKGTIHNAVLSADILLIRNVVFAVCRYITPTQPTAGRYHASSNTSHNTSFFGLCKEDWRITPFKKGKFTISADDTIARHAECMKELHAEAVNKPNNTPSKVTDSNSSNNDVTPNESTSPDENEGINMDHVI
jgi:hypothetical protein